MHFSAPTQQEAVLQMMCLKEHCPFFLFFLREKERHWSSDFTLQVGNRFEFSDRELKDSQCNENLHRIYTNYELTANISSIIPYLFLMFCVL